jgi:tetratricopeptide (TPR) repeat protein
VQPPLAAKPKGKPTAPKQPLAAAKPRDEGRSHFELSANAIDLESILGELESPPATAHAASESVEVDLSIVLDDIKRPQPAPPAPKAAGQVPAGSDIDGVFEHLRDEAGRRSALIAAEEQYKRGLALKEAGDLDGCVQALQEASRAPKLRFATASLLGRIFRDRGMTPQAVEWFERAAQAPAPTADEAHDLLYDLAEALEKQGEIARALAVCLELQADAGSYRDIAARIDRLTKVQTRG